MKNNLKQNLETPLLKAASKDAILSLRKIHGRKNALSLELSKEIAKIDTLEQHIQKKINKIKNHDIKNIMVKRYIDKLPFEAIAEKTNLSTATVYRLHKEGLSHIHHDASDAESN